MASAAARLASESICLTVILTVSFGADCKSLGFLLPIVRFHSVENIFPAISLFQRILDIRPWFKMELASDVLDLGMPDKDIAIAK